MHNKKACFFKDIFFRINDDDIFALSSQLAYALLVSFFPFLIFLMTILGMLPLDSNEVLIFLQKILPNSAFDLVENTVLDVLDSSKINLLSISILITLWTSSRGFRAVIKGLNRAYDERERRSFIKVQLISIFCTIAIIFIILFSFLAQIFTQQLRIFSLKYLKNDNFFNFTSNLSTYIILIISLFFIFAFIYKATPSRKIKWKSVIIGSLFSTLGWILSSYLFSFYVNNFGNYSSVYGGIASLFILLSWLYISSFIVILGGEVNATFTFIKEGKTKPKCKRF
ncbi:MAG: YihY/virulence factor BrkB family protein [Clostridiaceae bacterium]